MNFDTYKFRPHALGNIMGGIPKPLTPSQEITYKGLKDRHEGAGKPLTLKMIETLGDLSARKNAKLTLNDAAKKYLDKLIWEELTGRRETLIAKYLDKGIQVEEKSISLYSRVTNKLFLKNKDRKENEFFNGECDNAQRKIRDIKSSWSFSTFPLQDTEITNAGYKWQLDAYMDLWSFRESELIYCLVDTPFKLIEDELKRMDWRFNIMTPEGDVREESIPLVVETVSNHLYSFESLKEFCNANSVIELKWFEELFKEIPEEMRLKVFTHDYCKKRNQQMKDMVTLAREYMNTQLENLGDTILKFQKTA